MVLYSTIKLNTRALMPVLGFGTWKSKPGQVEKAVEIALKQGYRHIDTATGYNNEREVGIGIKMSGVPREEIFLTTKLSTDDMHPSLLRGALEASLTKLDTTYIDLWLVHWPAPMKNGQADKSIDWLDTWFAFEKLYTENKDKIRAIGVSNWSVKFMERLLKHATIVPAVNQIELHPSCPQTELVQYCLSRGILLTGFSPLGSSDSRLLEHPVVKKMAEKKGTNPSNMLLSLWANQENISVLSKSVTPERIIANFKLIELSNEEIAELLAIEKTQTFRVCNPDWTGWGSLGFPDCE